MGTARGNFPGRTQFDGVWRKNRHGKGQNARKRGSLSIFAVVPRGTMFIGSFVQTTPTFHVKRVTNSSMFQEYDVIVVGAGHAGCEAAAASANMGSKVLLVTMNLATIVQLSCNPA